MNKKILLDSVSTSKKISFLTDPGNYAEHTGNIDVLETHMSLLFLSENYVYKMKKPVKFDSVDFTTPASRYLNCREELRLNRILAKEVYLSLVCLNYDRTGKLSLGGAGRTVDWLVKMKRLREDYLLNKALLNRNVNREHLERAAEKLANFYHSRKPLIWEMNFFVNRLQKKIRENYHLLIHPDFGLPTKVLKEILDKQMEFLDKNSKLFRDRLRAGRVVDTHGDLKPEHIWLSEKPMIIDRLEFDRDLRLQDVSEELSLLAIECELLGSPETGEIFFSIYERITQDKVPQQLKIFYKSRQAALRAKFAIWHLREARYKEDPKWKKRAYACLQLSLKYSKLL